MTQVVAPDEGHVFHNRLTHTIKVAQIARRIAEHLQEKYPPLVAALGPIDADVVETAAFAHDLGHPPFGHIGEAVLDHLMRNPEPGRYPWTGVPDGYEGNAQAFRIITRLVVRSDQVGRPIFGCQLTYASLEATLKYPWIRDVSYDSFKHRKFGAYSSEVDALDECRTPSRAGTDQRSLEAQIMDLADDIAYSVHDVEDFYRAGFIPLDRLSQGNEHHYFREATERRWHHNKPRNANELFGSLGPALQIYGENGDRQRTVIINRPYDGTDDQKARLRRWTSQKIKEFVSNVELRADGDLSRLNDVVSLPTELRSQVEILKEFTRTYVQYNPALATQQHGHEKIIGGLFEMYWEVISVGKQERLSPRFRDKLAKADTESQKLRVIADFISSMTDAEAIRMYQRFSGFRSGSITDALVL